MSEAPGIVPEPEPETSDDGSSYLFTDTIPSEFEAQLNFKPYNNQQLSPTETFSDIATASTMYYQDSQQRAIKHTSTKSEAHAPYARPKSNTHVVRKDRLTSERAYQIFNAQYEQYIS